MSGRGVRGVPGQAGFEPKVIAMVNKASQDTGTVAVHSQAEANLSALIESTEDFIWSIDLSYRLLTFNRSLQRHIKSTFGTDAAIGKRPEDLLPAERAAIWPPLFERALVEGPFRAEVPFPGGRIVEMSFNPIVVGGKATGLSMFGKDVTERNERERQLRDDAQFLKETQRIGALGSYVLDFQTGLWTGSEFLDEMLGIRGESSHTVEQWLALIHPDDRARMAEYLHCEVMGKGETFNREYRIVRAIDGHERWVHGLGQLEFDDQGRLLKLSGLIKDITARKQSEIELRESEERYRATFEQAALGFMHVSNEGRVLRCNSRFAEIIGYRAEEIPGMNYRDFTFEEDVAASEAIGLRIASGLVSSATWEKRYLRKDGSITWVRVTASPQHDSRGQAQHMISLVEDINALKEAGERLEAVQRALAESEVRYRTAFQTSIDAININRLSDGRYIECNLAFLGIVGFEREEVIGHSSVELGLWADVRDREAMVAEVKRNGSCRDLEALFRKKNGEFFWGVMSASSLEIDGVSCVLTITRDISAAKAAEERVAAANQAMRVSEERYRTVFQTSIDPITISRSDNKEYLDINQAFLTLMGFERDEVIGRTSLDLNIWVDRRDFEKLGEILNSSTECRDIEIQFRKKNGETVWGMLSASIVEIDGAQCVLAIARDVSNAKAAEDEIRNLAFYDPLTGLPNRRLLLERLRQSLAVGNRAGRMRALLFVDLDNFKTLNDTLGHQTGYLLLQEAARRLSACVRDTDTVGRLGGDEFVLMLEDLSEVPEDAAAQAKAVGEKILAAVTQPYHLDGRECRSSASIGISVFGALKENSSEVLQQADIAMYQAKAAGRNTLRFFAPALQAVVNARAELEEDLRHAVGNEEFELYFQPQIDRNRLIGSEALIRWNHPKRGMLAPGEFIAQAEETGLIIPIGKWVLETSCRLIASWAGRRQTANLSIAVNISARQFRQPDFVEQVLTALKSTGANPGRLKLELTESMLLENIEEVIGKMRELKSHGLRFSLDDFGTGYSSLAYLKRLPLDQLKIDRSFIRDILADESSAAIAQTIISLSRAMGLPVIAEGVETDEQREFLNRLGCHAFQGFLFGRPLPLKEFERVWLPSAKTSGSVVD